MSLCLFVLVFRAGQWVAAPALSAPVSSSVGSFGGFGVPAPAPTPVGFTAPTPVSPSAAFVGFGVSPSTSATTSATTTSTLVEPPLGAPTPAPAPFGVTAALPVSPSAGFAGVGVSPSSPVITTITSTFVEPPSDEAYAVGGYGRAYPGWRRMKGEEFKAQAAAVVEAHTRGQGLSVLDAQTEFTSFGGADGLLYFDQHMLASCKTAGTLRTLKSSTGRAQLQTSTGGPGFGGPSHTTRWLDSPPSPEQNTQFAFHAAFAKPRADKPALFVRGVRFSR
jgi:hypothetical protein